MASPGIKEFHKYINTDFKKEIRDRYINFKILSEADLQSHIWHIISEYLKKYESKKGLHEVYNKLYLKELKIHPDLVVFRNKKPWVLFEIKESHKLRIKTAKKEFIRLTKAKEYFNKKSNLKIKRGYLIYVSRYGDEITIKGPKGVGARYFYEVPITLEDIWKKEKIKDWENKFKSLEKYVSK